MRLVKQMQRFAAIKYSLKTKTPALFAESGRFVR